MRRLVATLLTASLAACSDGGTGGDAGATSSSSPTAESVFSSAIAPMLAANCATCHLTGAEAGGMSLVPKNAIASLVGVASKEAAGVMRVAPGDPDKSYLVIKLEGTQIAHGGTGSRMPFGAPPLPPEKIALIRRWITEGAKP